MTESFFLAGFIVTFGATQPSSNQSPSFVLEIRYFQRILNNRPMRIPKRKNVKTKFSIVPLHP